MNKSSGNYLIFVILNRSWIQVANLYPSATIMAPSDCLPRINSSKLIFFCIPLSLLRFSSLLNSAPVLLVVYVSFLKNALSYTKDNCFWSSISLLITYIHICVRVCLNIYESCCKLFLCCQGIEIPWQQLHQLILYRKSYRLLIIQSYSTFKLAAAPSTLLYNIRVLPKPVGMRKQNMLATNNSGCCQAT